jgi:tRNA (guanine26-N2/guanine27-N2)-dimethyltransferase
MELDEVIEGGTRLLVPQSRTERGPGTIQGSVFYNKQMSFNRDVSVLFFTSPMIRPRRALDAMSATGARAVRIMNEARPDVEFHANDWDPEAAKVIASNIEMNGTCAASWPRRPSITSTSTLLAHRCRICTQPS